MEDFVSSNYEKIKWEIQSPLITTVVQLCQFRPFGDKSLLNFVLTKRGIRCRFPFLHNGQFHTSCLAENKNSDKRFCKTGDGATGELEQCSEKFKGKWSSLGS